jgi:hypothetical protein
LNQIQISSDLYLLFFHFSTSGDWNPPQITWLSHFSFFIISLFLTKFSPVQKKKKKKLLRTRTRQCDDHELKFQRSYCSRTTHHRSIHTMQKEQDSQGSNNCPKPGTLVWEKALTLQVSSEEHLDNRVIRKVTLSSPCLWASFHPLSPLSVVSTIHHSIRTLDFPT